MVESGHVRQKRCWDMVKTRVCVFKNI